LNAQYIQKINIVLTNIKNPEPAAKTSLFVGTIGNDVALPYQNSYVQLTKGSLISCSATFQNGLVSRFDNLTIRLTSLSVMTANSIVRIDFPNYY
jgi:hypothetical protein